MKRLVIFLLIIIYGFSAAAQKNVVASRDTINLRGYIFTSDGKPAKYMTIVTKPVKRGYDFRIRAYVDTNGYFEINGAKHFDTLIIGEHVFYTQPVYYNKGSRHMVIYLPPAKDHFEINEDSAVVISHKRIAQKTSPTDFIFPHTWGFLSDVHAPPAFRKIGDRTSYGSNEVQITNKKFIELVRQSVIYPLNAIKNNIEGTVRIAFDIPRDGEPINFKVINGIGYGCEQEVIAAIKKAGQWRPAIENGRPLISTQILTVEFKLTDK